MLLQAFKYDFANKWQVSHVWELKVVQGKILQSLREVVTLIYDTLPGLPKRAQVKYQVQTRPNR